jgi:hypothetical protein
MREELRRSFRLSKREKVSSERDVVGNERYNSKHGQSREQFQSSREEKSYVCRKAARQVMITGTKKKNEKNDRK